MTKGLPNCQDHVLIQLWQEGNAQAFEQIYKKYSALLLTIAVQKTADRELASEMVQDAFMTLFINKKKAGRITSLKAYLYMIIKNKILDHYRHKLVQQKYILYAQQSTSQVDYSSQNLLETKELEKQLETEIQKIPPQSRLVFTLKRNHYLSNKEIATELSISENTVEQHMRRALKILRRAFTHILS